MVANYTYGRGRDNESSDSGGGQDPLNVSDNWGYADSNIKHRLVTSFLWQLPSPEKGLAKAILGGWQFNGIVTLASGLPFTVASGRDTMLSFINSRANVVGYPNFPTHRPRSELIAMYSIRRRLPCLRQVPAIAPELHDRSGIQVKQTCRCPKFRIAGIGAPAVLRRGVQRVQQRQPEQPRCEYQLGDHRSHHHRRSRASDAVRIEDDVFI